MLHQADGGEGATAPRLGVGTLSCCPLTREEYGQSWDHLSSKGMPEQSSRLHTTLRLVFGNKVACQHFIRFLKTRGAEATQYFAFVLSVNQLNSKQSPPEDQGTTTPATCHLPPAICRPVLAACAHTRARLASGSQSGWC